MKIDSKKIALSLVVTVVLTTPLSLRAQAPQALIPSPWINTSNPNWSGMCKGSAYILERRRRNQPVNNFVEVFYNMPVFTTIAGNVPGRQFSELNQQSQKSIAQLEVDQRECERLRWNQRIQQNQTERRDNNLRTNPNSNDPGFGSGY